nr:sodium-dependent phosphate transport protein 2B-like [Odocoileus virginianus texanus]
MAPWPELENAQPTSEKYTVKADGEQSAKPEKGKETEKDDTGAPITKIELVPSHSTAALIEEPTEVEDPWDLPELQDTGIKWSGK